METAKLQIRIWTLGKLPDDLAAALRPHVERVAEQLSEGYLGGQIFHESDEDGDGGFQGWWEIEQ